jgi:hypothetical protein
VAFIGMHVIKYDRNSEETRAFIRDVLGLSSVDAGHGWLIFAAPPTELAVHPSDEGDRVELYLMCDSIEATIEELKRKGVKTGPIQDERWGRLTHLTLPSGDQLGIYEPKHPLATELTRS